MVGRGSRPGQSGAVFSAVLLLALSLLRAPYSVSRASLLAPYALPTEGSAGLVERLISGGLE